MPRARYILSSFVASLLFVGMLIAPFIFADYVESGEIDKFGLGLSGETVRGLEVADDLGEVTYDEVYPTNTDTGNFITSCRKDTPPVQSFTEVSQGDVFNLSTNLTVFGEGYGSAVMDYRGFVPSDNRYTTPPWDGIGNDFCGVQFLLNFTANDVLDSESLKFALHTEENTTWDYVQVSLTWGDPASNFATVTLVQEAYEYVSGTVGEVPITTLKRLEVAGAGFPDEATGDDWLHIIVSLYAPVEEIPLEGEVVMWDGELTKSREGLLANEGKLIAFNVGYVLIGGFVVVLATPWVGLDDIFGRTRRMNRKGEGSSFGTMAIVAGTLLVLGGGLFLGFGSFSDFFAASFLPFALAVFGVTLVAFTMRGKSSRTGTLLAALGAGVFGWFLGQTLQSSWLPFDKLYVAPFVDVVSGTADFTSAWTLSAFMVVFVIVAGVIVALYNIVSTIATDETISAVR